MKNEFRVANI